MLAPGDLMTACSMYLLAKDRELAFSQDYVGQIDVNDVLLVIAVERVGPWQAYDVLVLTSRGELGWTWIDNLRKA